MFSGKTGPPSECQFADCRGWLWQVLDRFTGNYDVKGIVRRRKSLRVGSGQRCFVAAPVAVDQFVRRYLRGKLRNISISNIRALRGKEFYKADPTWRHFRNLLLLLPAQEFEGKVEPRAAFVRVLWGRVVNVAMPAAALRSKTHASNLHAASTWRCGRCRRSLSRILRYQGFRATRPRHS